jgi:Uncharacterized protein conserved in bacteria (DUF2252)
MISGYLGNSSKFDEAIASLAMTYADQNERDHQRSLETSTRAATATAVRHLFAMAEISRLKRKADVEVRIVSIPGDWIPPVPGVFIKESMNNLADLGEKMGADPASWSDEPPAF